MELQKHITDEQTRISYTLCGDYYLPDLEVPKTYYPGRYAEAKLRYLKSCKKAIYTAMLIKGTLNDYLKETDSECEEAFDTISKQMMEAEGVTEQLKADNQMEWVRRMNSIRDRVNEIILAEYVNL